MVASGNDFVIVEGHQLTKLPGHQALARNICDRKYGIGADGLLLLERSQRADVRMRIFNADGSEAEMCGNGARCAALYTKNQKPRTKGQILIETRAGIIESQVGDDIVGIRLTDPKGIKLGIPLKIDSRTIKAGFINTGVPHAVIFVEGLDKINIVDLGRQIRYHREFFPQGANVDFVEVVSNNAIKVRTYERGVEDETLACGTGSVASALLTAYKLELTARSVGVHTKSAEVLKVSLDRVGNNFRNVWLEGKARIVYKGEYNV